MRSEVSAKRLAAWIGAAALAGSLAAVPAQAAPAQGKRIFISVDMEGIAGAVSPGQITPAGGDYQRSRKIMTDEVLAAIAGAREAGATDFVIADSHGDFENLIIEDLPPDVVLVRGGPRPLEMMEGIQNGRFDGVMFIGYHASASSPVGVRAHTFSSARLSEVKLNGAPASEGMFNAAVAAQFGAPVILATGDDAAMNELAPSIPGAERVVSKTAVGFHSAAALPPARVQEMIRASARRSIHRLGEIKAGRPVGPVTVDLTFHYYRPAELLAWLPGVARTGARSIRLKAADMVAASSLVAFILNYSVELQP